MRTAIQRQVDAGYLALGDELAHVEERHGAAAALGLVQRLTTTTKAAASPVENRLQRALADLCAVVGDEAAAQYLEATTAQIRAEQKRQGGGGVAEVTKFLAGGQGKGK